MSQYYKVDSSYMSNLTSNDISPRKSSHEFEEAWDLRGALKKMSQKVEKVHNFLNPPPSPRMIWTFLNLGKIGNLITPLRPKKI